MRHLLWLTTILSMLFLASVQIVFAQCESGCGTEVIGRQVDLMCGPKCLLVVCRKFGVVATLDELSKLSGKNESGTTLLGLYRAVEQKTLCASAMKIGMDELTDLHVPAIAYLWGSHFVVVENRAGVLDVTDPARENQQMSLDEFRVRYSGFVLLVARDKDSFLKADAREPDIRLDSYYLDLGFVEEGLMVERTIKVRNAGDMSLAVHKTRSTCACMTAEVVDKIIPPGGQSEIKLAFDTKNLGGGMVKDLYIHTNDPISPLVVLEVGISVKPKSVLVSSRRLNFGDMNVRQGATRNVYVRDPGDDSLKIEKIESDSPFVTTALVKDAEHKRYKISVALKEGISLGDFKGKVTVFTNHPKEPKVDIQITAKVKGDIDVFPDMFFLGLLKQGQGATKSVKVSNSGPYPLKITSVEDSLDGLKVQVSSTIPGKEYMLTATLSGNTPIGNIQHDVIVHTNNPLQPEIKVPIYALIKGN